MSKNQEIIYQEEIIDELLPPQYITSYVDNRDTVFSNASNSTNETLVESISNDSIIIPKIKVDDDGGSNSDYDEPNYNFTQEQNAEQPNGKRKKSIYKPVQKPPLHIVPTSFFHIFRFATPFDYFLMTLGIFFSILSGLLIPFMTFLLGKIFEVFTDKQIGIITSQIFDQRISSLLLQFSMLGVGSFVLISSMLICWMWTGERQSKTMKQVYFRSLLRMDIDYFERDDVTSGGLLTSVNKDAEDIQSVISEHMGYLIQDVVIIFSTLILAFTQHAL